MMSRIIRDTAAGTHTACDNSNKVCMKYEVSKLCHSQTLKTVISKKKKKIKFPGDIQIKDVYMSENYS